ncbi:MAG: secretin N-terminal domain-containing protein [Candidatus Zixiibacteriota bacterium]|jgi:type IV pilus secretin PilQ/predicted competence protein
MFSKTQKPVVLLGLLVLFLTSLCPVIADEAKNPGEPIETLQFQAADVHSVLTFLADYGGVNVVVAPDVKGTVTIKLHDVYWRTAMDIIGQTYGLAIVNEPEGYIRVLPEKQYREELTERRKHSAEQRQLVELQTQIVNIANSTSDDIVKAVESLLSDRGKATSDPRSNSIIIQEVPSNMDRVLAYIKELDKPAKQIKISTQILEISSDGLLELGVNWTATGTYTAESGRTVTQTGEVLADRVTNPVGRYSVGLFSHGWSVDAVVSTLVQEGKGKIVAHPEITTVDNKEARIQMGQKVPVKQFDESGNVITKFEEVGTILKVTPHITAANQILMHLMPERSTYQFDPNGVIINTSNAETNVIVGNGQTAVIGGLTTQDEIESVSGVPILKDIPLLGLLFKYKNKRTENRDLVIFVTPTVVDEEIAMNQ